ncbi:MAG: UvrB/UvrC motif-containing protein [Treponema sp.]|nr:UvrB/UvrC motif-containing protein [Treponema sp.]
MLCDICHTNEAVFFVEQTTSNTKHKLNFCSECIRQHGGSASPDDISKAINTLFKEFFKSQPDQEMVCPVCGNKLSAIITQGKAGCPECYEIFQKQIIAYMEKHKIYGKYTGLMPKRLASFRSVLTDRNDVRKKLELAVKNEDYEKAAFYRDYLHAIENKAVTSADGE